MYSCISSVNNSGFVTGRGGILNSQSLMIYVNWNSIFVALGISENIINASVSMHGSGKTTSIHKLMLHHYPCGPTEQIIFIIRDLLPSGTKSDKEKFV